MIPQKSKTIEFQICATSARTRGGPYHNAHKINERK